ncbi:hypothetical protein MMC18_005986 [Xylographa bjoerkii]|nr:hypothetical protein [Xylographa bjoerkii]
MILKKAPKGPKGGRKPWIFMKKGETMEDVMGENKNNACEKENGGLDHCACCGKEINEAGNKIGEKGGKDEGKGRVMAKPSVGAALEVAEETGSKVLAMDIEESETTSRGAVITRPRARKKDEGEAKARDEKGATAPNRKASKKLEAKAAGPVEQEIRDALKNGDQGNNAPKANAVEVHGEEIFEAVTSRKDAATKTSTKSKKAAAKSSTSEEKPDSEEWKDAEDTESGPEKVPFDAPGSTWITLCRPVFDIKKENYENGVDEDDVDEDADMSELPVERKRSASARSQQSCLQAGLHEEPDRKTAQLIALYGTLLLSTIELLIAQNEIHASSSIKNLGVVLGLFIQFAGDTGSNLCDDGDDGWTSRVVEMADKHGVEITGPFAIEATAKKIRDEMDEDDEEEDAEEKEDWEDDDGESGVERSWRTWDWVKELKAYARRAEGIVGGETYDITKVSKAHKKRYQYGR